VENQIRVLALRISALVPSFRTPHSGDPESSFSYVNGGENWIPGSALRAAPE